MVVGGLLCGLAAHPVRAATPGAAAGARPRNVIFILTDDHRFDALGFVARQVPASSPAARFAWLQTPHLDAPARGGVHLKNAFVTTALCSPSRASILTGVYAHRHGVVDNNNPIRPELAIFPRTLQQAGYRTGFFGKWHMGGDGDEPQPGFDRWVSFRGQGEYLPGPDHLLNIDGQRVPQRGYITDEITDHALDWLRGRSTDRPFFAYISHKGVHADFVPAARHAGRYRGKRLGRPASFAPSPAQSALMPRWVQDQRNSWHGVDYPYHSAIDLDEYFRRYAETLLSVDESVGRVVDFLRREKLLESTLVIYMGDNGFAFGEHGLIDKRTAYEESMRVPMIVHCPQLVRGGGVVTPMVANIDVGPTILDAAGLPPPAGLDGHSFLPLLRGQKPDAWRQDLLYEYFWERNFPHTPTVHALRGDRFKYVRVHGLWDLDELYDLVADPLEQDNLIAQPEHADRVKQMNARLFELLSAGDGLAIPLQKDRGGRNNRRRAAGAAPGGFPPSLIDR